MKHRLHENIGNLLKNGLSDKYELLMDPACGGRQQIPLFSRKAKSRKAGYCNVDLLILKNNKIKIIIEIEETGIKPIKIFGKFLSAASTTYYIHKSHSNQPIGMSRKVTFIQIVMESKLSRIKKEQLNNVAKSIRNIARPKGTKLHKFRYRLLWGNASDFKSKNRKSRKLIRLIKRFL